MSRARSFLCSAILSCSSVTLLSVPFGTSLSAAPTQTILHDFSAPLRGNGSESSLATDSAGNFYGTSYDGGAFNLGVVFKLSSTGSETVLHSFAGGTDGSYPSSGVVLDATGNLYGTTYDGGANNLGIVYKITAVGTESILHTFTGNTDGANPEGGVVLDAAGNLFGVTSEGGVAPTTFDAGVVYKLDPAGNETILHTFAAGTDGASAFAGLTIDKNGNLYGTTVSGGAHNSGVIFKITPAAEETILYNFTGGADGDFPEAPLTLGANGDLYGTTASGGTGHGVVFTLKPAGTQTVLYTFSGGDDGGSPSSGVVLDRKGNLYGTTPFGGPGGYGVVYTLTPAGKETVLYGFSTTASAQGQDSEGGVIFGANGHLYGATVAGGPGGTGVIYEVSGIGEESVLYNFPGSPGGFSPQGNLLRDQAGNLYGTNSDGGTGFGVIYKIGPNGLETVLHTFTGGLDGGLPLSGLTPDAEGNLYGTTVFGGPSNAGVVYKLDPSGNLTTVYGFTGQTDGSGPSSVVLDSSGNIYGTTDSGGASNLGVVFKITPAGVETVLHSFAGGADGQYPQSTVTRDPAGNLYGTTIGGGPNDAGVIYSVDRLGQESVLYSFTGNADGGEPVSGVVLDPAGNLYGAAGAGGANFGGVIYKLSGKIETVLFSFNSTDGAFPNALIRDPAGNLYGTTQLGGTGNDGVVFEITPAGAEVILLDLNGANGNAPRGVLLGPSGAVYGVTFQGGATGGGEVYELK